MNNNINFDKDMSIRPFLSSLLFSLSISLLITGNYTLGCVTLFTGNLLSTYISKSSKSEKILEYCISATGLIVVIVSGVFSYL